MRETIQQKIERGILLFNQGEYREAITLFKGVVSNDPRNAVSLNNLGICNLKLEQTDEAKEYFEQALEVKPDFPEARYNLALVQFNNNNFLAAADSYSKILGIAPRHPDIYLNLATSYAQTSEPQKAEKYYKFYLSINPNDSNALGNLGVVLSRQGKFDEAISQYQKALIVDPNYHDVYFNLAILYSRKKDYKNALEEFEKLVKINDKHSKALSHLVNRSPYILDWKRSKKYADMLDKLTDEEMSNGKVPGEQAFMNIIRVDNPERNLKLAKVWSDGILAQNAYTMEMLDLDKRKKGIKRKKLKVGYVSDGFRDFPTGHNIVRILELHNKKRFEVVAYSHGVDDGSTWRTRTINAVDDFVDIRSLKDLEAAKKINSDKVDILIDLKGHTKDSRLNIFSYRPAPVSIAWLGFPGSTGADFIDYMIADKIVIPKEQEKYYTEKILHMPHTYRPADNKAEVSIVPFERIDFGLPEDKIVFASFNSPYKLDPIMLDVWAEIMKVVPGSVLWQLQDDYDISDRLKKEFRKRGLEDDRLIIAEKLVKEAHYARMKLADLALDTRIVNGHTTTVDCLWSELPVVALLGNHFCSRVSASVLSAINLGELIAKDMNDYKKIAIKYALNKKLLKKTKDKIKDNKKTEPLFDSSRFTKDLESLYEKAWKTQHKT